MDHPYLGTQHLACVFSALQGKDVQQSALAGNPNAGSQLSIPHLKFVPQVVSLAHHPSPKLQRKNLKRQNFVKSIYRRYKVTLWYNT